MSNNRQSPPRTDARPAENNPRQPGPLPLRAQMAALRERIDEMTREDLDNVEPSPVFQIRKEQSP